MRRTVEVVNGLRVLGANAMVTVSIWPGHEKWFALGVSWLLMTKNVSLRRNPLPWRIVPRTRLSTASQGGIIRNGQSVQKLAMVAPNDGQLNVWNWICGRIPWKNPRNVVMPSANQSTAVVTHISVKTHALISFRMIYSQLALMNSLIAIESQILRCAVTTIIGRHVAILAVPQIWIAFNN